MKLEPGEMKQPPCNVEGVNEFSDRFEASNMKKGNVAVGQISTHLEPFYNRDGITIFCGDCLKIMPTLQGSFHAILADLPYG